MDDISALADARAEKQRIRQAFRRLRDSMGEEARAAGDTALILQLSRMPLYREARTVLLYASIGSEAGTWHIIDDCLRRGVRTVLPRVDKEAGKLVLYRIVDRAALRPGQFGIPEPEEDDTSRVSPEALDFALIPALAFDRSGARVGYGKGFYDRLLAECPAVTAGLCFSEQLAGKIPCEPHDRRVQILVTEKGVIDCHGHKKD